MANDAALREKEWHVCASAAFRAKARTQRAKRARNLAWAPPSMSCRGPLGSRS